MPEPLTIDRIELVRLPGQRSTPLPVAPNEAAYFLIRVGLGNHSTDRIFYVTAAITHIGYDVNRRVLYVSFRAPETLKGVRSPVTVDSIAVGPRSTASLEARIASPITYLDRGPEARWEQRMVCLDADVDHIELTVTHAEQAPPARVNFAAEAPEPLITWREASAAYHVQEQSDPTG